MKKKVAVIIAVVVERAYIVCRTVKTQVRKRSEREKSVKARDARLST